MNKKENIFLRGNYGVEKFVFFSMFYVILTLVLLFIKIFDINIPRIDEHDPMVLVYEILPTFVFILVLMFIGKKVFRIIKVEKRKYIIPIFLLSQGISFLIFFCVF